MAANLSKTSFGRSPSTAAEVIDAYSSGKLDAFIKTGDSASAAKSIEAIYPGVDASAILSYLNSESTQEFLGSIGGGISDALKYIGLSLPDCATTNDVLGLGSLEDLYTWLPKIKSALPLDIFKDMDLEFYKDLILKTAELSGSIVGNTDFAYADTLRKWGKAAGLLDGKVLTLDTLINAATTSGIAEMLARTGAGEELIDWLYSNDALPEAFKRKILGDLLRIAGAGSSWALLDALLEKIANEFTPFEAKQTIIGILGGYQLTGVSESNYTSSCTALLARLDALDNEWDVRKRNGVTTPWMHYLQYATNDALKVLCYNDRTRDMAMTYRAYKPPVEPYTVFYNRDFLI